MTPPLPVSAGLLLLALLPGPPCGALPTRGSGPGARQAPQPPPALHFLQPPPPPRPVLLRMGEGHVVLRLGDLRGSPAAPPSPASPPLAGRSGSRLPPDQAAANFFRAWLRRPLDSSAGPTERGRQEAPDRERRSEEPPISLDLTFHLLREVLEMARAEQLAQQADSNRKLMEIVGK